MRTAKYNDYTLLRILLFIVLIVLGIFAFRHFVKPPCEHTASSWVTVEATCTEDGYRYKECIKCGEQFNNNVLPATGHKVDDNIVPIEDATCTEKGTGYKACSVCKEQLEFVTIPATGHTPGKPVCNEIHHNTLSEGASYDEFIYCTECDEKLSEKKVSVNHEVITNNKVVVDPTCEEEGVLKILHYCVDCDKTLESYDTESIRALGHSFAWELAYDSVMDEFVITGNCTAPECNHEYDPNVDTDYTFVHSELNHDTCVHVTRTYTTSVYKNGVLVQNVSVNLDHEPNMEHVVNVKIIDENGNFIVDPTNYLVDDEGYIVDENGVRVDFLTAAVQYDENGQSYYNVSTLGVHRVQTSEWDENGFALGVFKCSNETGEHSHWVQVRVYNDLAN